MALIQYIGGLILLAGLSNWLTPLIPKPRQVGPYLDPIGGGQYAPLYNDKEHNCTEFDVEYCYDT